MGEIGDKAILYNLRYRWKEELKNIPDKELLELYSDFGFSDMFGDSDALFLEYVKKYR